MGDNIIAPDNRNPQPENRNPPPENNPPPPAQTLRQKIAPDWVQQPVAVQIPDLPNGVQFELKPGLLNQLPTFHGMAGENPNQHVSQFYQICSNMKPSTITLEQLLLRAFSFTLKDAANTWYYHLPANSITTWQQLKEVFLEEYFPPDQINVLKRDISSIKQKLDESFYEFYNRFQRLCRSCPYHGFR